MLDDMVLYLENQPDNDEGDKDPEPTSDDEVKIANKKFAEMEARELQAQIDEMEASEAAGSSVTVVVIEAGNVNISVTVPEEVTVTAEPVTAQTRNTVMAEEEKATVNIHVITQDEDAVMHEADAVNTPVTAQISDTVMSEAEPTVKTKSVILEDEILVEIDDEDEILTAEEIKVHHASVPVCWIFYKGVED